MARLTIIGPEGRQDADLLAHNTLGRHPNNTVQVLDRIVSKEHAHIDLMDGRYVLKDLGSLNGTYVNGERVSTKPLSPGGSCGNNCDPGAVCVSGACACPAGTMDCGGGCTSDPRRADSETLACERALHRVEDGIHVWRHDWCGTLRWPRRPDGRRHVLAAGRP